MDRSIIEEVENFVIALFRARLPQWRTFHNMHHTVEVAYRCEELASHYVLQEREHEILLVAAWFHDTGYCKGETDHEGESAKIARSFLTSYGIDHATQTQVEETIRATHYGSTPKSMVQRIICDADLYHLGSKDYPEWSSRLKYELEIQNDIRMTEQEWNNKNIEFLKSHVYHTDYAIDTWSKQKQFNLAALTKENK